MIKYILQIELRYNEVGEYRGKSCLNHTTKKTTIGTYKDIEQAYKEGNEHLIKLESLFKLNIYSSGETATKQRFKEGNHLVTNLGYLKTPFSLFAKIDTLHYHDFDKLIETATDAAKEHDLFIRK